jgi:hypothetical protein
LSGEVETVGTPVSTGRTAGFIRWKRRQVSPIVPDESGGKGGVFPPLCQMNLVEKCGGLFIVPNEFGTNDRINPVLRRFRKLYINQRYRRNLRDTISALIRENPKMISPNPHFVTHYI